VAPRGHCSCATLLPHLRHEHNNDCWTAGTKKLKPINATLTIVQHKIQI
jgi:acyl-CoA synthetase (AMP-forming)/AMP-acid ligase II